MRLNLVFDIEEFSITGQDSPPPGEKYENE